MLPAIDRLDEALSELDFSRRPGELPVPVIAAWTRKRLNTNRAVVVLRAPDDVDAAAFARGQRKRCAAAAGFYIPVLYGIGLQVVVIGGQRRTDPLDAVDTYDNQWCVLQSVFLVDADGQNPAGGRTWAQVVSNPIQVAIARALRLEARSDGPVASRATPTWVTWVLPLAGLGILLNLLRALFA